jgi:hypothetical protein
VRLYCEEEVIFAEQGVDPTQPTTVLSDGEETVRIAQGNFRYFGEAILDRFRVTNGRACDLACLGKPLLLRKSGS